jgi:type II secretory pathway component GspD/PulD (secretin)
MLPVFKRFAFLAILLATRGVPSVSWGDDTPANQIRVVESGAGLKESGYAPAGQPIAVQAMPAQPPQGQPGPGQPAGGPTATEAGGTAQPASGEAATESGNQPAIRRGAIITSKGDPVELRQAELGEDGRVAFQFRNQGWPELIQWLSELAGQPFDWLELPGDRVNITTPGRYTVKEVTDLVNRHLLGRGYTILALDGGMTVVKCSSINPAIVPRVAPEDLATVPPHSFVRTSLDVGWLSAEKLATELKSMVSENGKLTALTTTNRIEAMDAAITLRQIAELLAREQDAVSRQSLAPEFRLRHIPADEAKRLLEQFLGISKKPAAPMSPEQMQQMQQMQQMRMQQGGQPQAPESPSTDISVVANTRQNSILIQAPPDRVAVATEFLKRIDVPGDSITSLADVRSRVHVFRLASLDPEKLIEIVQEMNILEPSTRIRVDTDNRALIVSGSAADRFIIEQIISRLDGSGRQFEVLQLRRLEAADVAESISFLMGKKDDKEEPNRGRYNSFMWGGMQQPEKKKEDEFRVAANTRFRQVLLWANEAEMTEVRNLLVKLGELPSPDGSRRVVRTIEADASPETYQYLRGLEKQWRQISPNPLIIPAADRFAPEPKSEANSGPNATTGGSPGNPTGDKSGTSGEAGAGDEAKPNAVPPKSVEGEASAPLGSADDDLAATGSTAPHAALSSPLEAREAENSLLQLTAMQQTVAPTPANTPATPQDSGAPESTFGPIESVDDFDRAFPPKSVNNRLGKAFSDDPRGGAKPSSEAGSEAETGSGDSSGPGESGSGEPIRIEIDAAGNLVLSSSDTAALDRLEDVMLQYAPPRKNYHTFQTRHASATWIRLNLEDFFEQEDDEDDGTNNLSRWIFGFDQQKKEPGGKGLGRPAKLRFISDIDTGTIVVSNATADQLATIGELIRLWDVPEPVNDRKVRYTRLVSLKYSRAERIAETIKETYRDLLSSNDKAFQQGQPNQVGEQVSVPKNAVSTGRSSSGSALVDTGGTGQQGGGSDFSFKGKLSLGIDNVGNTLLVSAEGEPLLKLVCDMIDQLDSAARSSDGVRVVNLSSTINPATLEMALRTLNSAPASVPGDRSVGGPAVGKSNAGGSNGGGPSPPAAGPAAQGQSKSAGTGSRQESSAGMPDG